MTFNKRGDPSKELYELAFAAEVREQIVAWFSDRIFSTSWRESVQRRLEMNSLPGPAIPAVPNLAGLWKLVHRAMADVALSELLTAAGDPYQRASITKWRLKACMPGSPLLSSMFEELLGVFSGKMKGESSLLRSCSQNTMDIPFTYAA